MRAKTPPKTESAPLRVFDIQDVAPKYAVTVGLRFDLKDLQLLRQAALRDTDRVRGETSWYDRAADTIEGGSYLLVQCMGVDELQRIVARFARAGVSHVQIDTMRIGDPPRSPEFRSSKD